MKIIPKNDIKKLLDLLNGLKGLTKKMDQATTVWVAAKYWVKIRAKLKEINRAAQKFEK